MRDAAWKQKRHGGFAANTLQASRCRCRHRRLITIESVEDRGLRKRGKLPECLKWPRRYITHTHARTHAHAPTHRKPLNYKCRNRKFLPHPLSLRLWPCTKSISSAAGNQRTLSVEILWMHGLSPGGPPARLCAPPLPDGWPPLPSVPTGQPFHAVQIKEQRGWHHVSTQAGPEEALVLLLCGQEGLAPLDDHPEQVPHCPLLFVPLSWLIWSSFRQTAGLAFTTRQVWVIAEAWKWY